MSVTLREYLENLQKLVKENPRALNLPVIASQDVEGNGYRALYYSTPAIGNFDGRQFYANEDDEFVSKKSEVNAICIN